MSYATKKTEGGQGGKIGHSKMVHYDGTEVVKAEAKKARRNDDKKLARKAIKGEE